MYVRYVEKITQDGADEDPAQAARLDEQPKTTCYFVVNEDANEQIRFHSQRLRDSQNNIVIG